MYARRFARRVLVMALIVLQCAARRKGVQGLLRAGGSQGGMATRSAALQARLMHAGTPGTAPAVARERGSAMERQQTPPSLFRSISGFEQPHKDCQAPSTAAHVQHETEQNGAVSDALDPGKEDLSQRLSSVSSTDVEGINKAERSISEPPASSDDHRRAHPGYSEDSESFTSSESSMNLESSKNSESSLSSESDIHSGSSESSTDSESDIHSESSESSLSSEDSSSSSEGSNSSSSSNIIDPCVGYSSIVLTPPKPHIHGTDECSAEVPNDETDYYCNPSGTGLYQVNFQFHDPTPAKTLVESAVFDFYGAFDCLSHEQENETTSGFAFLLDQHVVFEYPLKSGNCTHPYCTEHPICNCFYFIIYLFIYLLSKCHLLLLDYFHLLRHLHYFFYYFNMLRLLFLKKTICL